MAAPKALPAVSPMPPTSSTTPPTTNGARAAPRVWYANTTVSEAGRRSRTSAGGVTRTAASGGDRVTMISSVLVRWTQPTTDAAANAADQTR